MRALVFTLFVLSQGSAAGNARPARSTAAPADHPTARAIAGPAERALRDGDYPWFDPESGQPRPMLSPRRSWLDQIGRQLQRLARAFANLLDRFRITPGSATTPGLSSDLLVKGLFLAAIVAFVTALVVLWWRRGSVAADRSVATAAVGRDPRLSDLPDGVQPGSGDPWAEAERKRAAGDLAGAVVALFAYQLLALDRQGLIRLAPGRTGRQYVQAVARPGVVESLEATLALFEDVYYGGKQPATDAFDAVWRRALVFKEHANRPGASI